jgi:hypothetical protein
MVNIAAVKDNSAQCLNDKIKDNSISECMLYKNEISAWRNSIRTLISTIIKALQREVNANDMAGPWSTIYEIGKELNTRN